MGVWAFSQFTKAKAAKVIVIAAAMVAASLFHGVEVFGQVPDRCVPLPEMGVPGSSAVCGAQVPTETQEAIQLPGGLNYRRFSCRISYESLPNAGHERVSCHHRRATFHELSIQPNQGLQLFALHNPGAHVNPSCKNGYGGPVMSEVINRQNLYEVAGAINGNYFVPDGSQFKPRGFLWSQRILGNIGLHGQRVFVADQAGNHEVSILPAPCENNPAEVCAVVTDCDNHYLTWLGVYTLPTHAMGTYEFVRYLRRLFPTMTMAVQLNTSLLRSQWGPGGNLFEPDPSNPQVMLPHYSRCTPERRRDPAQRWKCQRTSRTALCGRDDGGISLLTMDSGYMYDLAVALSPGGPCGFSCRFLYSLDGGGSSQLGLQLPARDGGENNHFTMLYGQSTGHNRGACGPYRAVDHLFVIGRYLR